MFNPPMGEGRGRPSDHRQHPPRQPFSPTEFAFLPERPPDDRSPGARRNMGLQAHDGSTPPMARPDHAGRGANGAEFMGYSQYMKPGGGPGTRLPPHPAMHVPQPSPGAGPSSNTGSGSPSTNPGKKTTKRRPDDNSTTAEEKRTKTGRACDACRSKKIRCDILTAEAGPGTDAQPICAHCKQSGTECTFFLPITETRFKKRRQVPDATGSPASKGAATANGQDAKPGAGGPASILSLVHTAIPSRSFEQFDMANHAYWEVSEDDNGRIQVEARSDDGEDDDGSHAQRLSKYVLPGSIMTALVNSYFDNVAKFLPIVSRSEFLKQKSPYPLLLYSMCAATATRREFPRHVFQRMRGLVNGLLRANEVLSHACIENIQSILLINTNGELSAQPTAPTASAAMMRLTAAIRMAQDLGLHREQSTAKPRTVEELEAVELRRRIWSMCVVYDAWYVGALALPLIINVLDCDVPLPSPYSLDADGQAVKVPEYSCLTENTKLALILGRVFRTMYRPTGLQQATDAELKSILDDLEAWREGLPEELRFNGPESSELSGMLHLKFVSVQFLFWRGFLRVAQPPPAHLRTTLDTNRWQQLVHWSRETIEWLAGHNTVLDSIFVFPYTATSCALVQYHMWARKRDAASLETLKLVRDTVARWEEALQPDQMSTRKKSCETMMLLYEAALKTIPDDDHHTERSEGTPVSSSGSGTGSAAQRSDGLAPAFGKRSQAHAEQQSQYFANVELGGSKLVEYPTEANGTAQFWDPDDPGHDVSFLDNIPESNFDWLGWGQYFETVDRIFAQNDEGQQTGDEDVTMSEDAGGDDGA